MDSAPNYKPLTTAEAWANLRGAFLRAVADLYRFLRARKTADGFDAMAAKAEGERWRLRADVLRGVGEDPATSPLFPGGPREVGHDGEIMVWRDGEWVWEPGPASPPTDAPQLDIKPLTTEEAIAALRTTMAGAAEAPSFILDLVRHVGETIAASPLPPDAPQ